MSLEPGQVIEGKYRIVRLLGEGGMGAVYEGENTAIQRKVAIKILHAAVAGNSDAVSRFEKEAQAAGRIGSDHITEVLDLGTLPNGDRFMVMEYLDGTTLSGRIQARGRLTPQECAPILVQLLEGLGAAHDAQIIHRDLKPDNVFLLKSKAGRKDFVKILDFGISKFNQLSGDGAMSMTRTGSVMGTPYYMSPEQAKGAKEIDARSDLYSVGVIVFESITGQVPFNADTFNELIFKIVLETAPPPETLVPDLDPAFANLVKRSMAREPTQRFQNAAEFQAAVVEWMQTGNVPMFEESHTTLGRGTMGSHGGAPATPAPWSQGAGDAPAPKKSSAGLIGGIAAAALVVLAGGGFLAMKLGGSKDPPPAPAATSSAEAPPHPAESAATSASAAPAPVVSPAPSASEDHVAEATPEKKATKGAPTPGHKGAPTAGKKEPATPPATPPPQQGGRKIRTEL